MSRRYRISFGMLHRTIENAFRELSNLGQDVSVNGKINRIGEGLWHDNYWFWITGKSLPPEWTERAYVLRLLVQREEWQEGPEPKERLLRESQTLLKLKELELGYPTPEFICSVRDRSEPIGMIETAVPGASMEMFKDETTLRSIARVAAAVHRLERRTFSHLQNSFDRAQHAMQRLDEITKSIFDEFPLANEAREWIIGHLPSSEISPCLLHGDLLPQNLVIDLKGWQRETARIGIVDWEMARIGDPAYDLAIVSRANRKVLGVNNGSNLLLQAYLDAGGQPITLLNVRVHEILLVLNWLQESWQAYQKPERRGQPPEFYEQQLRSVLRRAANDG